MSTRIDSSPRVNGPSSRPGIPVSGGELLPVVTATWATVAFEQHQGAGRFSHRPSRALKSVRNSRPGAVTKYLAAVSDIDRRVFCPLSFAQALADHGFGHEDDEWWYEYDAGWLRHCDDMIVRMPPGWAESRGVRMQIEVAEKLGTTSSCTAWNYALCSQDSHSKLACNSCAQHIKRIFLSAWMLHYAETYR